MNALSPALGTILIADDDADDRLMVQEALGNSNLHCVLQFAEDGAELLDRLNRTGPFADLTMTSLPELILLDLNMPKVSGLEALRAIKADARLRAIPVIVWTTSHCVEDRDASYRAGAELFLTKPTQFNEMEQLLREMARSWLHGGE